MPTEAAAVRRGGCCLGALLVLASAGCGREGTPHAAPRAAAVESHAAANAGEPAAPGARAPGSRTSAERSTSSCPGLVPSPSYLPAAPRVVAIGDVHGDLETTVRVLALAGAVGADRRWRGGDLVVVQTGDVLDRGDDEEAILELFASLAEQAAAVGGAFVQLNGNHEYMNAAGDFRYVTPGGFADFSAAAATAQQAVERARRFAPGGDWAVRLARLQTAIVVGDTLFVHGGVEARFAGDVQDWNCTARRWLAGLGEVPEAVTAEDGPVWSRAFGGEVVDCKALSAALARAGVSRMVVGHTVQPSGVTSACEGQVWRIDVGLARAYGGPLQALELRGGEVTVLRGDGPARPR